MHGSPPRSLLPRPAFSEQEEQAFQMLESDIEIDRVLDVVFAQVED